MIRKTARQATRWDTQDEAFRDSKDMAFGLRWAILEMLEERPSTCDELELACNRTHQSVSAAINGLMRDGEIRAAGTRKTRSGRSARVWEICPRY